MASTVSNLSNDVERVVLQPLSEVADFVPSRKQSVCLVQEDFGNLVHERLILHQGTHGERTVNRSPKIRMIRFIGCRK
jgi:hypothetical protein